MNGCESARIILVRKKMTTDFRLGLIGMFVVVIIGYTYLQFFPCCSYCLTNGCAPCPNPDLVHNVSVFKGWEGVDACAGDWFMYCREYQNTYNYTTDTNVSCWRNKK